MLLSYVNRQPIRDCTCLNLYRVAQSRLVQLPDYFNVGAIIKAPCMVLRSLPRFQGAPLFVHCTDNMSFPEHF